MIQKLWLLRSARCSAIPNADTSCRPEILQRAKDFKEEVLYDRRVQFYRFVREQTKNWIRKQNKVKLVHVTTVPVSLEGFLSSQVGYMKKQGFEIHAVSSPGEPLQRFSLKEQVPAHPVKMHRRITPFRDLFALARLWFLFRKLRPHLVHSHTPKGGLLGSLAAWLANVPVRVYTIHGLPMTTAKGFKRCLLRWTDRIACRCSHQVIAVSKSIRDVAVRERLCPAEKIKVLCNGSINGVDAIGQFNPIFHNLESRRLLRQKHQIPIDAPVVGYVGRIVRDKGMAELAQAWSILRKEYPALHLLLVGPFEPQDPAPKEVESLFRSDPRIHLAGQVMDTPPYYAAIDVCVLPTYREGLPGVPLEAAAMTVPTVATRIPGCICAVKDGVTGLLVPPRNAQALADALRRYLDSPLLRQEHGKAGREYVLRNFNPKIIWEALYQEYINLLQEKGLPVPGPKQSSTAIPGTERRAA